MDNKKSLRQIILIQLGLILAAWVPYLVRFALSSGKWDIYLFITGRAGFSKQLTLVLPHFGFAVLLILSLVRPSYFLAVRGIARKRWQVALGVGVVVMGLLFYSLANIGLSLSTQLSYLLLLLWWLILFSTAIMLPEVQKPGVFSRRGETAIFISFVLLVSLGVSYLVVGLNEMGQSFHTVTEGPDQSQAVLFHDPFYYGITNPNYYPFYIFNGEHPAPSIKTLQELAAGADTDQEVIDNVVDYFEELQDKISVDFEEENPERLKALYVMYLVHLSHPYGLQDHTSETLIDFIFNIDVAECYQITRYQSVLMDGFGLTWRSFYMDGLHTWLEVDIDGKWEIFDATSNTWVNHGIYELMKGESRTYRNFYSPWLDESQEGARINAQQLLDERQYIYLPGTNKLIVLNTTGPGVLRSFVPGFGIYYPPAKFCEGDESLCIPLIDAQSWPIEKSP